MNNKYVVIIILAFLLSGCGARSINLGFKNTNDTTKHPILIHITNDSKQSVFSKVVKFDDIYLSDGQGELFNIIKGTHQLEIKWLGILNNGNSYFITGVLPSDTFLNPTKTYRIKANFENGYTYMIDQGLSYNNDKYIPSKLCLLKRPTLKDEVSAYKDGTITNNMKVVKCYRYGGNYKKDYNTASRPW